MKIKSINISAFGALENFSLNFTDGFNVIYGENEDGKSTIMAFIKMMFYGGKGGSKIKTSRSKYFPWNGKAPAGSITFEHKGRNYRIEREFKGSNSTDKVFLFDLDMGTKTAAAADIGKELFGLSEAAFERSIFIGALTGEKSDSEAEGEINAKLSNLSSGGDEDISFTKVLSRLEKAKLAISSKKGTAGIMDKNIHSLKALEEQYKEAYAQQKKIADLKASANGILDEITGLNNEFEQVKKKIEEFENIKNTQKIKEFLKLKKDLDELNQNFTLSDGKFIDEIFVNTLSFSIAKIENLDQKLLQKRNEEKLIEDNIELLNNPTEDMSEENAQKFANDIEKKKTEINKAEEQFLRLQGALKVKEQELSVAKDKKKAFNPLLLSASGLFLASAVLFYFINLSVVAIPLIVVALISIILGFILKPNDTKLSENLRDEISKLQELISVQSSNKEKFSLELQILTEKLNAINNILSGNSAVLEKQKETLLKCKEEIAQILTVKSQEEGKLFAFFAKFKNVQSIEDVSQQLPILTEFTKKQKEIKQQLNYLSKDLGNISYEEAEKILAKSQGGNEPISTDISELNDKFEEISNLIADKKSSYSSIITEITLLERRTLNPDTLFNQIRELKEKIASQQNYCSQCDIAIEILKDSFVELRKNYGSVLEKKSAEILSQLTLGEYTDMSISNTFEINVEKKDVFGQKEIDYLSAGTTDQAYLSLRLALASLMEVGVSLPVLLDDPFIQYDDKRTKKALEFFNYFAKKHQVILFTCHGFIANDCDESCNNLIKL